MVVTLGWAPKKTLIVIDTVTIIGKLNAEIALCHLHGLIASFAYELGFSIIFCMQYQQAINVKKS